MAKYFATEAAQDNALDCMRIHGGYGYSTEFRPERYYRDAPLLLIGEGSNEIQQLIIARRLLERTAQAAVNFAQPGGARRDPRGSARAVRAVSRRVLACARARSLPGGVRRPR